jgi:inosine-uridine nucleoside N-ribohydrolase
MINGTTLGRCAALFVFALGGVVHAHEAVSAGPVVVDTDMGIDDAVALALALQDPQLEISAIVACVGVAEKTNAAEMVGRLLGLFNRHDIPLYASEIATHRGAPTCRPRAQELVHLALPAATREVPATFVPAAYRATDGQSTVLALGPLSQLADALERDPALAETIARVVVAGDPADLESWNIARDPKAVKAVRRAGIRLQFVAAREGAAKPAAWRAEVWSSSRSTSIGDVMLDRLLRDPDARTHYLETLDHLHDELAVLYVIEPWLFEASGSGDVFTPREGGAVSDRLAELMRRGRQRKRRVVLSDRPIPDDMLQPDVRARRQAIIASNGEDEWFAQLLLNELHEHLGAYSIIGVKMALRAAELLNAPPHAMSIRSAAPATQPVSCLNDGLLVATGSTPGRGLFSHRPGPPDTVEATFTYNGRTVTLRLRSPYRDLIRSRITQLLEFNSLKDPGYWEGVRELGLDIWEGWHRLDLFEVMAADRTLPTGAGGD